jgi:hypothetical protein
MPDQPPPLCKNPRPKSGPLLPLLALLVLLSSLGGCDLIKLFTGTQEEKQQAQQQIFSAISSMITDVTTTLKQQGITGLSSEQVATLSSTVSQIANDAVALTQLPPDDLERLIPVAAGAAVGALGQLAHVWGLPCWSFSKVPVFAGFFKDRPLQRRKT